MLESVDAQILGPKQGPKHKLVRSKKSEVKRMKQKAKAKSPKHKNQEPEQKQSQSNSCITDSNATKQT